MEKKSAKPIYTFFFLMLLILFSSFTNTKRSENKVLFSLPNRDITVLEFSSFLDKTEITYHQENFDTILQSFIDYHLKIARGRDQKLHRTAEFVNEFTDYRISLAAPYLTHSETRKYFVQQAYERLQFEVNADHLLIPMHDEITNAGDTISFYNKAISVRNNYLKRKNNDQEKVVNVNDHEYPFRNLGYFTAFQSDYRFESVAYQLKNGEISMPVRTHLGYHIIRVNDKKPVRNLPSFKLLEDKIFESIENALDQRIKRINQAFTEDLKEYWDFSDDQTVLKRYYQQLDSQLFAKDFSLPMPVNQSDTLCTIDNKALTMKDFWRYLDDFREEDTSGIVYKSIEMQINYFYDQFVAHRLFLYENYMLEEKYPEFKSQLTAYKDAMLLLAATKKNVWNISDKQEDKTNENLMHAWVEELRRTIPVVLNTDAIRQLKKDWISIK